MQLQNCVSKLIFIKNIYIYSINFFGHQKTSIEKSLIHKLPSWQHPWSVMADRDSRKGGWGRQEYRKGRGIQVPEFYLCPHHSCL